MFKPSGHFAKDRARFILRTYAMMGYNVIVPGADDFVFSAAFLKQELARSPIDLVCANLSPALSRAAGALPYVRLQRGSSRILVTGVIDPEVVGKGRFVGHPDALKEPVTALRKVLEKVSYDFSIVVVHAGTQRLEEIITQIAKQVDVVIAGTQPGVMDKPGIVSKAVLVRNNFHGKVVCALDFPDQKLQQKLQIVKLPKKSVSPDNEIAEMLKAQLDREWLLRREQKIVEQGRLRQATPASNYYLGQDWCQRCHIKVYKAWQETPHANAIETLRTRRRETDPDCFPCHVTGMSKKSKGVRPEFGGGFVSLQLTPHLADVQCEACHGPGGFHSRDPQKFKMVPGDEFGCRGCHTVETDPDFIFKSPHPSVR